MGGGGGIDKSRETVTCCKAWDGGWGGEGEGRYASFKRATRFGDLKVRAVFTIYVHMCYSSLFNVSLLYLYVHEAL